MRFFYSFIIILSLSNIVSCSSSFDELSKHNKVPSNQFSKYLLKTYKIKADFEAKEMHDWNSAKLYSEKALKGAKGVNIKPEKISYWNIPKNKINELRIAYNNLMLIYDDAISKDPYNLAVAISSLDCWAEQQEENWQIWDINKCRDDFLDSIHKIYNNLEKNNKKVEKKTEPKDSSLVVAKNNKSEILQIIYFDFDKAKLSEVSIKSIKNFIDKNKNIIEQYLIVGHTDTKGTIDYNLKLSLERANAVKSILIENGINLDKIKILGEGEENLLVQTDDEVAHPANRRAEIKPIN